MELYYEIGDELGFDGGADSPAEPAPSDLVGQLQQLQRENAQLRSQLDETERIAQTLAEKIHRIAQIVRKAAERQARGMGVGQPQSRQTSSGALIPDEVIPPSQASGQVIDVEPSQEESQNQSQSQSQGQSQDKEQERPKDWWRWIKPWADDDGIGL
jgi:hypothetical protein